MLDFCGGGTQVTDGRTSIEGKRKREEVGPVSTPQPYELGKLKKKARGKAGQFSRSPSEKSNAGVFFKCTMTHLVKTPP